jgi:hypothetical protein
MPARIGDIRTPSQKEAESKKAVYGLLTDEPQSWGILRRASDKLGISSATLSKYLKQFIEEGIVVKSEEDRNEKSVNLKLKISRTYYRLTLQKAINGGLTEREMYAFLKHTKGIEFSKEEDAAWSYMDTALKIFTWSLARVLTNSSHMDVDRASRYVQTMLQVSLKEELDEVVKIYQKCKNVKNGSMHMADFAAESFMILAEESAEAWIPEDIRKKYGGRLPEPEISIAWALLTSKDEREAIGKIEKEIDDLQEAIAASYKE